MVFVQRMAHVQLHELFCTSLIDLWWYGVDKVLPLSLLSLRTLTCQAFTDVDRRAGFFRRVTAVTISDGSFVLKASPEVRADGLFVRLKQAKQGPR
jgi:hypothetical protein